jgi:pimeloyl-ACP methyl ester carboxylesterase
VVRVVVAPAETMSVTTSGAGTPIVIIPGMLGGAYGFRKVTAVLTEHHDRVLIIDPLGTGGSSHPSAADYSMAAQAQRVAAVLDSLGIAHALVVGHAAGAPIALRLALLRPHVVSGVISINGSASEKFSSGGLKLALRLAPILKLFGAQHRAQQHVISGLRDSSADPAWVTDDVVAAYTAPYKADFDATLRVLKAVAHATEPWPLLSRLHEVRVPVLLVLGTGAPKGALKSDEIAAMKKALPAMRIDSITSAGAFPQEEKPDLLVQAIKRGF